jgi:hypothetical protein
MNAYRVIPYDASAAPTEKGGALFVPGSTQNRIDNPALYSVLYVAKQREAAVAESFGRLPVWTPETFVHANGNRMTLMTYEIPDDIALFELDNVDALKTIGIIKPSSVVTRVRTRTQAWARAIYELGGYAGATWWSYYYPDWTIIGLWDRTAVRVVGAPEPLDVDSAIVKETAAAIVRQISR